MTTGFEMQDFYNRTTADSKLKRKFSLRSISLRISLMDFQDKLITQSFRLTVFTHLIRYIVGICSKPQVSRITTRFYIASMANMLPFWYRPISQFVGETVRRMKAAFEMKLPITASVNSPSPKPTRLSFPQSRPKVFRLTVPVRSGVVWIAGHSANFIRFNQAYNSL
jgi:hypothetical protein